MKKMVELLIYSLIVFWWQEVLDCTCVKEAEELVVILCMLKKN